MRVWLTLLACCVGTSTAFAKRPLEYSIGKGAPAEHRDLKDHTLYEVRFDCKPGAGLTVDSSGIRRGITNFFVRRDEAANHYLIVSNDVASPDPSDTGKIKLPDKAISIIPVFSIKGDGVVANFAACQKTIYVQATQRIYLIPTVASSKQYAEGAGLAALYEATKLISPLWSIFNPASLPATIASKISNVQATEDPVKNILSKLNNDQNYGKSIRLQTGRYVIATKYSSISVQVSPISSVVTALSDELRQDFRAALDAAPQKIPSADFEDTCKLIATNLAGAGFSQNEDIPYALTYLASTALQSKDNIIQCLGNSYAVRAARLGKILWAWIPDDKKVSEDEASVVFPPLAGPRLQPKFRTIEGSLDDFIRALSRVAKNRDANGKALLQYVNELKGEMAPTVLVNDKTDAAAFDQLPPLDAPALGERFVSNGYNRFGCYAELTDKFGNNPDGAVAIFLSFKVAKGAPAPAPYDSVMGIRTLFGKEGHVSQMTITDKRQVLSAALEANSWSCNGYTVQKP